MVAENITEMMNYNVEVDIIEERTTIIEEMMSPTFIALAAGVAAATVIVILLIGLICHRICKPGPGYTIAKVQVYLISYHFCLRVKVGKRFNKLFSGWRH